MLPNMACNDGMTGRSVTKQCVPEARYVQRGRLAAPVQQGIRGSRDGGHLAAPVLQRMVKAR